MEGREFTLPFIYVKKSLATCHISGEHSTADGSLILKSMSTTTGAQLRCRSPYREVPLVFKTKLQAAAVNCAYEKDYVSFFFQVITYLRHRQPEAINSQHCSFSAKLTIIFFILYLYYTTYGIICQIGDFTILGRWRSWRRSFAIILELSLFVRLSSNAIRFSILCLFIMLSPLYCLFWSR